MKSLKTIGMTLLLAFPLMGCAEDATPPLGPDDLSVPVTAKGGAKGGGGRTEGVADVIAGDLLLGTEDAPALASTCPGSTGRNTWTLVFGHSECLIVEPKWNPASSYAPYTLADDVVLSVTHEKGKNGRLTHIQLGGQDVIGEAGIAHETDRVLVAIPVVPRDDGFVLHVHAKNVEVWRKSGHTRGDRVEMIGWISIGDIVYSPR